MNKLIDKSLNALFKLADRITGRVAGVSSQDDAPPIPPKIRFTKDDDGFHDDFNVSDELKIEYYDDC